jgi:von Willebrand factor type A domain-containing protein
MQRFIHLTLAATLVFAIHGVTLGQSGKPLTEEALVQRLKAGLDDDEIVTQIEKKGIAFPVDEAALERLKKAGASPAVLAAMQKAAPVKPAANAVTYEAVLKMLLKDTEEAEILKALEQSPTAFTLSAEQAAELKKAGASEKLLAAMQKPRGAAGKVGSDVTALAIILDCSGSMKEYTKDRESKMNAAKRVVTQLIDKLPNGLEVSFIIYGHDAALKCEAVKVVRPLAVLDDDGKKDLKTAVSFLQPTGHTPIALSLRVTGAELAKTKGLCEIVLVTDGMETCHGDPAAEATALFSKVNLKSVEVIGVAVDPKEQAEVEKIANAGKGHFYNARNAKDLADAFRKTVPGAGNLVPGDPSVVSKPTVVSAIIAMPITLKGFPEVNRALIYKAGEYGKVVNVQPVQIGRKMGEPMVVAPGEYDVWYDAVGNSNYVCVASNLTVGAKETITVRPDKMVSAVVVKDLGLPGVEISQLQVYPPGERKYNTPLVQMTTVSSGLKPMLLLPNQEYQVVMVPKGGQSVPLQKIAPKPGELIVIGGDGAAAPAKPEEQGAASRREERTASKPATPDSGAKPQIDTLIANLKSNSPETRRAAAVSLGELGDAAKPAVPAMIERIGDLRGTLAGTQMMTVDESRIAAVVALKRIAPDKVEEALQGAAQSRDLPLRLFAVKLLKDLKSGSGSKGDGKEANSPPPKRFAEPAGRFKESGQQKESGSQKVTGPQKM